MNRRGFTIIEMAVSVAILAVLMVACGTTVRMAVSVAGEHTQRTTAQLQAADAAAMIADDLNVAVAFTQKTAAGVTFTVPNRDGGTVPQTVAYAWATPNGPITRSFGGGPAKAIVPSAKSLAFTYATRTAGPDPAPAEQNVFDHRSTSGSLNDYNLTNQKWACQSFTPDLPSGASSYSIRRARALMKAGTQDSVLLVQVRAADVFGAPTATVLGQTRLYVSALSNAYEWVDIPITGVGGLSPSAKVCVVFGYAEGATSAAALQSDTALLTILSGAKWYTSSNAGASWSGGSALTCANLVVDATVP